MKGFQNGDSGNKRVSRAGLRGRHLSGLRARNIGFLLDLRALRLGIRRHHGGNAFFRRKRHNDSGIPASSAVKGFLHLPPTYPFTKTSSGQYAGACFIKPLFFLNKIADGKQSFGNRKELIVILVNNYVGTDD